MSSPELADAASRLCLNCGLCCNGVLFQIVRLQPTDSVRELEYLGMKLSRKKHEPYFKQPCGFLKECTCSIYDARPLRCRLFECRQLQLLAEAEVSEDDVIRAIESAKNKVENVAALLATLGNTSNHLPLSERYDQVMSSASHDELRLAMEELQEVLNAEFRLAQL